jgi:hypothetical protein
MTPTTATQAPAKPRRRRPRASAPKTIVPEPRVTKRKLTLADAADQWEQADREIERLQALRKEAAPVLLEHFERTGRHSYKDRIALRQGADRTILDQNAVKEFLGQRLTEFQTRVSPRPSLSRLQK